MFRYAPLAALLLLIPAVQQEAPSRETEGRAAPVLERGQYLVEHVAMCSQCHTPRHEDGTIDRTRLLHGAAVPVRSPFRDRWASRAPHLAGLPGHSGEDIRRLLTEGLTRHGRPPLPPMPPYRMTTEDADAVIAYLRSLR